MSAFIRTAVIVVAIAVAALAGWRWMFPDDAAQIRAALARIAGAMRVDAGEGDMARLVRLQGLGDELAPGIMVDAGAPFGHLEGRGDVLAAAGRFMAAVDGVDIRFVDAEVVVAPDRARAAVTVTAEARFEGQAGAGIDARELALVYLRQDGRWRLASVALVRVLQPVGYWPAAGPSPALT